MLSVIKISTAESMDIPGHASPPQSEEIRTTKPETSNSPLSKECQRATLLKGKVANITYFKQKVNPQTQGKSSTFWA